MGFIWGQKVRGSVRKGRKSSNLFFRNPRKPSHVEFCSESFFIEIPQLSIITELSMPITFFIFVLSWRQTTQKTSKNERGRRAVTACYLLETDVSLFFFAKIIHLQLSSKEKLRSAKFQKSLDAVNFSAFNFYLIISHPHMENLKGNQFGVRHSFICWPVFPELMISSRFSHAKDLRFFSLLQKSPMDLGVFTPTFNGVKWMDRVVG